MVAQAQGDDQGVDRVHLDAASSTLVADIGSVDVIAPDGRDRAQGGEPVDELRALFRTPDALEQLLEDQASDDDIGAVGQ